MTNNRYWIVPERYVLVRGPQRKKQAVAPAKVRRLQPGGGTRLAWRCYYLHKKRFAPVMKDDRPERVPTDSQIRKALVNMDRAWIRQTRKSYRFPINEFTRFQELMERLKAAAAARGETELSAAEREVVRGALARQIRIMSRKEEQPRRLAF